MKKSKKYSLLTCSQRKTIIITHEKHANISYRNLQKLLEYKHSIKTSVSTICRILKNKKYILAQPESFIKKIKTPKFPKLEEKLLSWLLEKQEKRIPINNVFY